MKHLLLAAALYLLPLFALTQTQVKLYYEKDGQKINLYASSELYCPASIKLDLQTTNMQCEGACPQWLLIPARAQKHPITTLTPIELRKPFKFGFSSRWFYGDVLVANHNSEQPYYLPYEKGKEYKVVQGYNGPSSHNAQNALDFNMPEGTIITAAREGVVVKVVQNFNTACPEERCKEFNNYILIYHNDGTFAEYTHLRLNGSLVQPGNLVKGGQMIGYSGNTGWSRGPHLHFMVYVVKENGIVTIPTRFKHNNTLLFLQPGERYTRTYD